MEEIVKKPTTSNVLEEMAQESGSNVDVAVLKEMADHGIMYGHKKSRTNPRFKSFIFTTRNGFEIIDLTKTLKGIEEVSKIFSKAADEKKTILLVGTQPASWEAIAKISAKFNFPLIKNKWIGGLITNYKVVGQRLEFFRKESKGFEKGEFQKYTKKERGVIAKKLEKMKVMFEGLDNLNRVPDMIFVIDTSLRNHKTAIAEAKVAKIPVIAIIDNDDNPDEINYAIAANDHAKLSINWVVDKILEGAGVGSHQE